MMSKRETRLLAIACTFIGIVVGFLLAPIKAGTSVSCGNNNRLVPPESHMEKRRERKHVTPEPLSQEDDLEEFI